ncbi:unnamed protein product [Moneuplotes crassus]|uniref:DNA replication ATP-dependent helicase/nuclease n=1 Tax=Euplotes crassus TaxID=5936 RepID=A0AAD1UHS3_EUPCR|nr:unnamed protein product [Moneuplotes crassus]
MYVFTDRIFEVCGPPNREESSQTQTIVLKLPEDGGESPVRPKVLLRGNWYKTPIDEGDHIRVIGTFCLENEYTLVLENGYTYDPNVKSDINYAEYIILEPDIMVSSTTITSSFPCVRRGVFSEIFKSSSIEKKGNMVLGNIVHSTFEKFVARIHKEMESIKEIKKSEVTEMINEAVSSHIVSLRQVNMPEEHAREFLKKSVNAIITWLGGIMKPDSKEFNIQLKECVGTEQEYQSTKYGFRGKIDSIVVLKDKKLNEDSFAALELKTGKKEQGHHRAQVILYALLIMERFAESASPRNLLLYIMKTGKTHIIKAAREEFCALIQRRNELAKLQKLCNLGKPMILPPMLNEKKAKECEFCYMNRQCSMYALAIENIEESSYIPRFPKFTESRTTMCALSRDYFKKWFEIIAIEQSSYNSSFNKKKKRVLPREENLRMVEVSPIIEACSSTNTFTVRLQKPIYGYMKLIDFNEGNYTNLHGTGTTIHISKGIILKKHIAQLDERVFPSNKVKIEYEDDMKNETKNELKKHCFVSLEDLGENEKECEKEEAELKQFDCKKSDPVKSQIPKGRKALEYIIEFRGVNRMNLEPSSLGGKHSSEIIWRLESETTNTYQFNIMRNNLFLMLMKHEFKKQKNYIVYNHEPTFEDDEALDRYEKTFSHYVEDLNEEQKIAVIRSLGTKEFQCILSLPGTGEMLVIERIVKCATILKKKVLLMASNNSLVDATLINIKEKYPDLKLFRLNNDAKGTDSRLINETRNGNTWESKNEIDQLIEETQVFSTTTMSMFHPFLLGLIQKFDYVIVQEASAITEPITIGPCLLGKAVIMFGDYYISNPSVKSIDADRKGLGRSLFKRLCDQYTSKIIVLKHQYRMNKNICKLINSIAYSGLMKHGSEAVKVAKICYPNEVIARFPWIQEVKSPERSVVFLNIDNVLKKTMPSDICTMRTKNFYEAAVIKGLVCAFLESGIQTRDIAVVSPIRNHLYMLQNHLREQKVKCVNIERVGELSKDIIIVSCVKCTRVFPSLKDIRRLYLGFVRVKKKLIIVGSKNNIIGIEPINKFIKYIDTKNWYLDINNLQQIIRYLPKEARRVMSKFKTTRKQDREDLKVKIKKTSPVKSETETSKLVKNQ